MTKILLIEDDATINGLIQEFLQDKGCCCTPAYSGTEGRLLVDMEKFELILLDLMIPGMSGQDLLEYIRAGLQTPVIVLSARTALEDKVELLGMGADDKATKALCLEMNNDIDAQQKAVLKSQEAERELKYTIACVSHDIRTPLTGASGYIQLLEKTADEKKQRKYGTIVRQKLRDLEELLDELFLYTRLTGDAFPMEISKVRLLPLLCDVLNEFSLPFQEQKREPLLSFEDETIEVLGDEQQLRRVFHNLISNALAHGMGTLYIEQKGASLIFQNQVPEPEKLHPEWLFQRFYRTDMSRQGTHAGLGLSIARELIERMGGKIWGERKDTMLCIKIAFALKRKQEKENLR